MSYVVLSNHLSIVLVVSFGATMVLLYGFPENPFSQPKNIFLGHMITAATGVIMLDLISLNVYLLISLSVGLAIFFMIMSDCIHPPAGGNPIAVILGNHSYDFLIFSIALGSLLIIILGVIFNRYVMGINYPSKS